MLWSVKETLPPLRAGTGGFYLETRPILPSSSMAGPSSDRQDPCGMRVRPGLLSALLCPSLPLFGGARHLLCPPKWAGGEPGTPRVPVLGAQPIPPPALHRL